MHDLRNMNITICELKGTQAKTLQLLSRLHEQHCALTSRCEANPPEGLQSDQVHNEAAYDFLSLCTRQIWESCTRQWKASSDAAAAALSAAITLAEGHLQLMAATVRSAERAKLADSVTHNKTSCSLLRMIPQAAGIRIAVALGLGSMARLCMVTQETRSWSHEAMRQVGRCEDKHAG